MRACTVRITKCDRPLAWYAKHIGREFAVYADRLTSHNDYVLKEDYDRVGGTYWRHIELEDAVEVEEGADAQTANN